jgi:hypothetical protein
MELRVIPPRKKAPNKYDSDTTFVIPAKLIQIHRINQVGSVVPIIIERLDFKKGNVISSPAITFQGSLDIFDDINKIPPFYTDCIVYKENGKIRFKVVGIYNAGFAELFYSVADNILDNDERQIFNVFKSNYKELDEWSDQS